jgi:uncharacterized membrane protein
LTAVDVIVAASCGLGQEWLFECVTYKKLVKYQLAVDNGMIAMVVPFVMAPFGVMAKLAKVFIEQVLGPNALPLTLSKARLRLAVAAARGMVCLTHVWHTCSALIAGNF